MEAFSRWNNITKMRTINIDKINEVPLGPEAFSYVREVLSAGNALAEGILKGLPLDAGRISTYLPEGLTPTAVNQFRFGGKLSQQLAQPVGRSFISNSKRGHYTPVPNLDMLLVARISAHLKSAPGAICMFESPLAKAGDKWVRRSKIHSLVYGNDVYHILVSDDTTELVQLTLKKSRAVAPPLFGVLSRWSSESSFTSGEIELADLKKIAKCTEQFLVGAYDGESFLVWKK
jgi:hypothetical protein